MPIPLRILRAEAAILWPKPVPPPAQREREADILLVAEQMFARHRRADVTFRATADLAGLAITTLRRYFADIEAIQGAILTRHLRDLIQTIGAVPAGAHQATQRRAAYRAAIAGPHEGHSPAHKLLQSREELPDDVRGPIETLRLELATLLAGAHGQTALRLLDAPDIPLNQIEAMLDAAEPSQTPAPAASPQPAPRPAQPAFTPAVQASRGALLGGASLPAPRPSG